MKRIFAVVSLFWVLVLPVNAATITKGLVGEQDISHYDGVNSTFTRSSSTGATLTLNRVGGEVDALMAYGGGVHYNSTTINSALTAIGTTDRVSLCLRPGTWTMNANITITSNIVLKILPGASVVTTGYTLTNQGIIIHGGIISGSGTFTNSGSVKVEGGTFTSTGTVTINGDFESVNACFLGPATYSFATNITINQRWFGTTNAALQLAVGALAAGNKWYLPQGTYTLSAKLNVPYYITMYGDGPAYTIISSTVSGDYSISISHATGAYATYTELRDFQITGDAAADAGSSSTGGLYINNIYHLKLARITAQKFCTQGWTTGTPGNTTTELRAGIYIRGTAYSSMEDCDMLYNDVGLRIDNGAFTVSTSLDIRNCHARMNRTHASKMDEVMTTWWNGGVIESNRGNYTIHISNDIYDPTGVKLADLHFEDNFAGISPAASPNREIYFAGLGHGQIVLDNLFGLAGEYSVELAGTSNTTIIGGQYGLTPGGPFKINADCANTVLLGPRVNSYAAMSDAGTNTVIVQARPVLYSTTRDMAAESGTVAYSVPAFKGIPSIIMCKSTLADTSVADGIGFGTTSVMTIMDAAASNKIGRSAGIAFGGMIGAGTQQAAVVSSVGYGTFDLTWTKQGSPTGTLNLDFILLP